MTDDRAFPATSPGSEALKRVRIRHFAKAKQDGTKISGLTSYDFLSARIFDAAGIDFLLVGDSAGNNVFGYDTTLPVSIDCYAASGLLIKTLTYKDINDFGGGIKRPATLETQSPLQKGYKSLMLYGSIKARKVADEVFTLEYLPRIKELR